MDTGEERFVERLAGMYAEVGPLLDERQRRLVLGAAARQIGRGGIKRAVELRKRRSADFARLSIVDPLCSESDRLFRKRPDRFVLIGAGPCRLVFDLAWCSRSWTGFQRRGDGI